MIHVILGGKSNALGVARSLARTEGEVHVLTVKPSRICKFSRFVDCYRCMNGTADTLQVLQKYDAKCVKILYPTSDLWAGFIAEHESILRYGGFIFLTVPADTMTLLMDKFFLYKAFKDLLLMPETVLASRRDSFSKGKDFIVKPRRSFAGDSVVEKGFRSELEGSSEFLVQEKLSMDVCNHYSVSGVAKGGELIFAGLTNKVYEYPTPGGTATLVVSSVVDADFYEKAIGIAEKIVSVVNYEGVFEVEIIHHRGELWFLEMNPRFWLQHEIFSLIDVNISRLYMSLCIGEPVQCPEKKKSDKLVWLHEGFWISMLAKTVSTPYSFFRLMKIFFVDRKICAHWRFFDPLPFFGLLYDMVTKRK